MLPVSAWPPGAPGASGSPFGQPQTVCAQGGFGYPIPKGAWVVQTTSNQVLFYVVPQPSPYSPSRPIGTGLLPGQPPPPPGPPQPQPPVRPGYSPTYGLANTPSTPFPTKTPPPWCLPVFPTSDVYLESWRAYQRRIGRTDTPVFPQPGRTPPNFFGYPQCLPPGTQTFNLLGPYSSGLVLSDGWNTVVSGSGPATIIQAFNV